MPPLPLHSPPDTPVSPAVSVKRVKVKDLTALDNLAPPTHSLPRDQAGPMYAGHNSPDVQDSRTQCSHPRLLAERPIPGRDQIQ